MTTVDIVLFDGIDELDFCGPFETLASCRRLVNGKWAGNGAFKVQTIAEYRSPIRTAHGLTITPDTTFDRAPEASVVIVPGGPGAQNEHLPQRLVEFLAYSADTSEIVASICTGAFVLARAGLTDFHRVTTHHARCADLQRMYPKTKVIAGPRLLVDGRDNNLLTTGALSCGIDLALYLIARYEGRDTAVFAAKRLGWPIDAPTPATLSAPAKASSVSAASVLAGS
jgi:transcriptional regulator GlxA family with amidase domain